MLDTSKLIKSHLHVKCDFFLARNAKGPYLVSISKLGLGNYTALFGPILLSEGLYLKNCVPISELQGPYCHDQARWQV